MSNHLNTGSLVLSSLPAVHELIRQCCKRFADHVAIEEAERIVCYGELAQRAYEVQTRLAAIEPGSVIAVIGHRSVEAIVAAWAVWLHGCVVMAIDDGLPAERQRQMCESVPPAAILHCGETIELAFAAVSPIRLTSTDSDHAYIAFTSGSTGRPKAILGSHRGLAHFLLWQGREFDIVPSDRFAHLTNLSFDVWFRDAFTPLTHGATLCIPGERHLGARDLFEFLDGRSITAMHVVPSVANHWIHSAPQSQENNSLRLAFFAGEPLEGLLVRRWRERFASCEVINLYGPTETTLAKHFKRVSSQPPAGIQSVGRPLPDSVTHILDDQLQPCAVGVLGEICIETPYHSHGYLLDTGLSSPFLDLELPSGPTCGVYRTGDLGLRRPDGEIEIRGRIDDQVKINGVRIELLEVKSAIVAFPGVRDVFVCAIGEGYQRTLAAVLEATPEVTDLLVAHLRQRLPPAMVPSRVLTCSALPRLPNGKLNRPELSRLAASAISPPSQSVARQATGDADVMDRLESLWKQVLRADTVDPHRNFFESGGSSLTIVELHARIEESFQIRFPLVRLFEHATLASQATLLGSDAGADTATVTPRSKFARQADQRARTLSARQRSLRQME